MEVVADSGRVPFGFLGTGTRKSRVGVGKDDVKHRMIIDDISNDTCKILT